MSGIEIGNTPKAYLHVLYIMHITSIKEYPPAYLIELNSNSLILSILPEAILNIGYRSIILINFNSDFVGYSLRCQYFKSVKTENECRKWSIYFPFK